MSVAVAVTVLFWVSVATLAIGLARRARLWRSGREATVEWTGLLAVPKRYFVDLHHVVARDPYIANTHIATAGGAFAALVLVAINYGLGLYAPVLDWAILLAAAVMLTGVYFVWMRRRHPPLRLSRGAWNRLPYTLAAFALGLALLTLVSSQTLSAGIAIAALALLLAGSAELALGIGAGGPMKHAVAGLLHLAFHPRPERFAGVRSTALSPLALSNNDFGTRTPSDFLWTELLSFDACVECGKCEQSCPAFGAGQPLNPKKLIQDLVAGLSGSNDSAYAGRPYPGIPIGSHRGALSAAIIPKLIEAETVWSCTTCRACVEECPMLIEHVDAIVGMRRSLNLTQGEVPGTAPETLCNLRETETQGGHARTARYNWVIDLDVSVAAPGKPVDLLLIAGEGAFDMRYQRTLRALVKLLKAARVDFAILGERERDTGDTARRLGDEATFQALAKRNIETFASLDFKRIVTSDPHVLHSLRNEYPALGGKYTVVHHTALLAELAEQGKLQLGKSAEARALTYHDPCYLGRYNGETEAPRALLRKLGIEVREMQRSGLRGRCCGGGGGAPLTDIPGKQRIPDIRMADARDAGADVIAVACPQCTAMLEGVAGARAEVLDIAELAAASLEARA
ncbi:(Fe-S)-binding protein [Hyphomicrobium sp.]|uniref:(Fe-S)-binding protein n=1 Tax=Hyphomicrobium sp. TaxID=82 RepID=UPI001D27FAFE|nr:(Fe-S)-binding protein [Hyphomicrobium sp.]MBY0559499.1 (Fe-S)-binding protein [Hyphomicrobium sp.]